MHRCLNNATSSSPAGTELTTIWRKWDIINFLWPLTHWGRDKMAAIFQMTFSNAFSRMKIYEFWLRFVPKGPINNIPALVQIMAWRWSGDRPLSEPTMASLLMHICITRPQWVKYFGIILPDEISFLKINHRENSPVTQRTPEPTLLSWGGWPRKKFSPTPGHTASLVLSC